MANIVRKPNGTYLIRISAGKDDRGKSVTVSRTFTPSKPTLSYLSLQKEMNLFIENLQVQILNGEILDASGRKIAPNSSSKTLFRDFCEKFLEIKASEIAPGTLAFYRQIIQTHLIPTHGMMRLEEFRVRHVQDYIQFVMAKGRQDIHHPGEQMAAATVKRYATVFRSILSLAYKMEYIDNDISASRRLVFPKNDRKEVEVYSADEVRQILEALEEESVNIKLLVELALFTGCRRGEIVGLRWSDIDFDAHRLYVRRSIYKPKSGKAFEKEPKTKKQQTGYGDPRTTVGNTQHLPGESKQIRRYDGRWMESGRMDFHRTRRSCDESADTDQAVRPLSQAARHPAPEISRSATYQCHHASCQWMRHQNRFHAVGAQRY